MPVTDKNYTDAQTLEMVKRYEAEGIETTEPAHDARAKVVEALAVEFKKPIRSIRSKLVREDVYIARSATSKVTGEKPAKKDVMAIALVASAGDTSGVSKLVLNAESVEKMNKTDISIITAQFKAMSAKIAEQETELVAYLTEFGDLPETEDENDSQEPESES